jgi:hypothetical protein
VAPLSFRVQEELAEYDPDLRRSTQEGGSWPHPNHYHFNEAVVASYFLLRGYQVLRGFSSTRLDIKHPIASLSTRILHQVVGPDVSNFFLTELAGATGHGSGEPDLFVFREEHPEDPKIGYPDPRLWFFVEVKGPGDRVSSNQKRFWREVAKRSDLGLGPERIRLFKTAPFGKARQLNVVEY